jgi:hypothetical protein
MTKDEALRLALEALEWQQEMLYTAMQYSAAKGMTFLGHPPNPNEAITAIKAALEAKDEPVAWRDAAIRLGEELSSVGPNGYYDMDAKEWLNWAMEQNPRGEHSLPQRTWVGLTDEEIAEALGDEIDSVYMTDFRRVEAKLKEKNT